MAQGFFDLLPEFIIGAEGEEDNAGSNSGDSEDNSSNDSTGGEENAGSSSEDASTDNSSDSDAAALKRALESERRARREAEKRVKQYDKAKEEAELAKKGEVEQATARAEKAQQRLENLTAGYVKLNLDSAIRAAAGDFTDPSDALAGVDRSKIVYEQDEDDPSIVTVNAKSVKDAVKALATEKPHWLKQGTNDGDKTGSKFGAGQSQRKSPEEDLKEKYPALR